MGFIHFYTHDFFFSFYSLGNINRISCIISHCILNRQLVELWSKAEKYYGNYVITSIPSHYIYIISILDQWFSSSKVHWIIFMLLVVDYALKRDYPSVSILCYSFLSSIHRFSLYPHHCFFSLLQLARLLLLLLAFFSFFSSFRLGHNKFLRRRRRE